MATSPASSAATPRPGADPRSNGETRSTHDQSVDPTARPQGAGGAHPRDEPQLPHEIDESRHSQARASDRQVDLGKQAYADATGPAEDTDRGPVLEELYDRSVAPDRDATPPRQ